MRLQPLTLDEVCTSLGILDDVGIVKMEGKRDMMKRMVSRLAHAWRENCGQFREAGAMLCVAGSHAIPHALVVYMDLSPKLPG